MATQAPILINPSPKTRFQQSADNIKKHRELVDSNEFQRGCDFALLQYQTKLASQQVDGQLAAASHFKVLGVLEFLQEFRFLSETIPTVVAKDRDNLNQS